MESTAAPTSNLLRTFSTSIEGPHPFRPMAYVQVVSTNFNPFFSALRTAILDALVPGHDGAPDGFITNDDWRIVCRYLLRSRVDYVYSKMNGVRHEHRCLIPTHMSIPKALADTINGVGSVPILAGGVVIVPEPEEHPAQADQRLGALATRAMVEQFNQLVTSAHSRGFINVSTISMIPEGTPYWLLGAYDLYDRAIATGDNVSVNIRSCFKEFTQVDALQAAIVQTGSTGFTPNDVHHNWVIGPIRGATGFRKEWCLKA